MNNLYKSPFKTSKVSLQSQSYSKTPNINKNKPFHSQSKYTSSLKMNQAVSQAYTNVLNRLLRINQLPQFVKQATRYVVLSQSVVADFIVNEKESRKSRRQVPQIGKTLLIDGGFIKHYCKLMQNYFADKKNEIRQSCYDKYKYEVIYRKKMFDVYFKQQIKKEHSNVFQLMMSRSKSKQCSSKKSRLKSSKKPQNKIKNPLNLQYRPQSQPSQLQHSQSNNNDISITNFTCNPIKESFNSETCIFYSNKKQPKTQKQEQIVQVQSDDQYASPYYKSMNKRQQTDEQRERRLQGSMKRSENRSSGIKIKRTITTFYERMANDKLLAQIYKQVIKKKIQKQNKQIKNPYTPNPIVRTSIDEKWQLMKAVMVKKISSEPYQNLSAIEKDMINRFPNLTMKGKKAAVSVKYSMVLGTYKNYIVKKVIVTDIHSYRQQLYVALQLETIDQKDRPNIPEYDFQEKDQNFELILVD